MLEPAVPSWHGSRRAIGLEGYAQELRIYRRAGLKHDDQHLAATRTWRNLRDEARHAVRVLGPEKLRDKDGIELMIKTLEEGHPDRALKKSPRLYKRLFRECRHSPRSDTRRIFYDFKDRARELEVADDQAELSSEPEGLLRAWRMALMKARTRSTVPAH